MLARARGRLAHEGGFSIIEVLVSAIVVVVLSLGVFAAIDAAGNTASNNKSRSDASSLAHSDQERMRAMTVDELSKLGTQTKTVTVDKEQYTVVSTASYVSGPADATSSGCTSSEQSPRYMQLTSKVTWQNMRGIKPVQEDSLRAIPNGSLNGLGSLAVSIVNRSGAGVSGVPVKIAGPQTTTINTDSNGCALFGYAKTGTYTLTFTKAGYVEAVYPNRASISDSVILGSDALATKSYQYDQAGGVKVNYQTSAYGTNGTLTAVNGGAFTISNSLMGSVDSKTTTHTSATSGQTGLVNFPFTSAYKVWAGGCDENYPGDTLMTTPGGLLAAQNATVTPGATTTLNVREPRLRVKIQRRNSTSTTSTTNYATMPNDGKTTVKFKAAGGTGCVPDTAGTFVSNTGSAGSSASNYSTWEAPLPFGTYTVCAAYSNGSTNRASTTATGVVSTTLNGTTYGTTILVPYNETSGYTC